MAVDSNSKQRIPELFLEIMKHDLAEPVPPTAIVDDRGVIVFAGPVWSAWRQEHRQWRKRQQELIRTAEERLAWNHNKGNTA